MSLKRPQRRYPAIPPPGNDIASLQASINALKEAVETLVRLRGDESDSAVAVRDLQNLPPDIGFTPTKLSDWGASPPRTVQAALDALITGSGGTTPAPSSGLQVHAWGQLGAGAATATTITNGSGLMRYWGGAFDWNVSDYTTGGQASIGLVWLREVQLLAPLPANEAKVQILVRSTNLDIANHFATFLGGRLYVFSWVGIAKTATIDNRHYHPNNLNPPTSDISGLGTITINYHQPQPANNPIHVTVLTIP